MNINNRLHKTASLLTVVLLAFWFVITASLFYLYISSSYLNEYREFSNADCALQFFYGNNPFSIESHPQSIYLYGPLFPWISSILYSILPVSNILILMRILSVLFTIGSCLIVWKELKEETFITKTIAVCITTVSGWSVVSLSAFPNSMGTFFFILSMCIIKHTSNSKGLIWTSLLAATTFFIKQYYIIILAPVLIYLFIKSRNLLYRFILIFIVVFIIETLVCYIMFPLYFEYTFTHHIHMRFGKSFAHLWKQMEVISTIYFPLFAVLIYKIYKQIKKSNFKFNTLQNSNISIYSLAFIIMSVVLIRLGEHHGAYLTYFYQLAIIPLVICSFNNLNRFTLPIKRYIHLAVVIITLIIPLGNSIASINNIKVNLGNWDRTYKELDSYPKKKILILTPVLNHYAYKHNLFIANTGQTEYLPTLISSRFKGANRKCIQGSLYYDSIQTCISKKQYDVIYNDINSFIKNEEIKKNYILTDSIKLNFDIYNNSNSIFKSFTIFKWVKNKG